MAVPAGPHRRKAKQAASAALTPSQRRAAPTNEVGAPAPAYNVHGGPFGGMPMIQFIDDREYAADLRWPRSTEVYTRMETDAQLRGLGMATTMPVRRFRWEIDPNEARPEVVEHVAAARNLPIRGGEPVARRARGFSADRHLAHALRAPFYGHYYFEEVYEYRDPRDGGDGLMHLKKLGTRPPRTIINLLVDEHGDLTGIVQNVGMLGAGRGAMGILDNLGGRPIDASRLLPYIWDSEDDGDWIGRSMLRAVYRNWLIKDRLLRVDATKHERNAMGIPWFEVDRNATKPQIEELAKIAEEVRVGSRGGGAGVGKLRIAGVEGNLPDTIGSVRYHDEQMSKAFLLLLFNLGGDATSGSRALGETFKDWYPESQGALADWFVESTQKQIENEVEINWGPDEQPPLIAYTRLESTDVGFEELALAIEKGLIVVDEEMRAYIGERWKLPGQSGAPALAQPTPREPLPPIVPPTAAEGDPSNEGGKQEPPQPARSALAAAMLEAVTGPTSWPDLARAVDRDPKNGTARRARDQLVEAGAILKRRDGTLAPMLELSLPDRDLKRNPKPYEVEASVDFAEMERVYESGRDSLVAAVRAAQAEQIVELTDAVEAAEGDAAKLASLTVEPVPTEIIAEHLIETARAGEASARAEHQAQMGGAQAKAPVSAAEANKDEVDAAVTDRAEAAALTLAAGLATAASKRAAAVATLPPTEAAEQVGTYLSGLSDAALEEQLGGAIMQGYNTGRRAYMRVNDPSTVYASEIMDRNTCTACNSIDGSEWPTVEASEAAYPLGGYIDCEGGLRCRGTVVAVY